MNCFLTMRSIDSTSKPRHAEQEVWLRSRAVHSTQPESSQFDGHNLGSSCPSTPEAEMPRDATVSPLNVQSTATETLNDALPPKEAGSDQPQSREQIQNELCTKYGDLQWRHVECLANIIYDVRTNRNRIIKDFYLAAKRDKFMKCTSPTTSSAEEKSSWPARRGIKWKEFPQEHMSARKRALTDDFENLCTKRAAEKKDRLKKQLAGAASPELLALPVSSLQDALHEPDRDEPMWVQPEEFNMPPSYYDELEEVWMDIQTYQNITFDQWLQCVMLAKFDFRTALELIDIVLELTRGRLDVEMSPLQKETFAKQFDRDCDRGNFFKLQAEHFPTWYPCDLVEFYYTHKSKCQASRFSFCSCNKRSDPASEAEFAYRFECINCIKYADSMSTRLGSEHKRCAVCNTYFRHAPSTHTTICRKFKCDRKILWFGAHNNSIYKYWQCLQNDENIRITARQMLENLLHEFDDTTQDWKNYKPSRSSKASPRLVSEKFSRKSRAKCLVMLTAEELSKYRTEPYYEHTCLTAYARLESKINVGADLTLAEQCDIRRELFYSSAHRIAGNRKRKARFVLDFIDRWTPPVWIPEAKCKQMKLEVAELKKQQQQDGSVQRESKFGPHSILQLDNFTYDTRIVIDKASSFDVNPNGVASFSESGRRIQFAESR